MPRRSSFANLQDTVTRPFRHEAESRRLSFDVQIDPTLTQHHDRLEAPAAGAEEPAVQRVQVHRAGRRQAQHLSRRPAAGAPDHPVLNAARRRSWRSRCPTPASASRPRSSASSSRRSSRPTPAPAANTAAPASAWRSAASCRTCSAARSSCAARPAAGSTFTLYLPLDYVGPATRNAPSARRGVHGTQCVPALSCGRPSEMPIEQVADDRHDIAARRHGAADRRGRSALRAHHRGSGARQRIEGAGRDARRAMRCRWRANISRRPSRWTCSCPTCSAGRC